MTDAMQKNSGPFSSLVDNSTIQLNDVSQQPLDYFLMENISQQ